MAYDGFYGDLSTRGTSSDLLNQATSIRAEIVDLASSVLINTERANASVASAQSAANNAKTSEIIATSAATSASGAVVLAQQAKDTVDSVAGPVTALANQALSTANGLNSQISSAVSLASSANTASQNAVNQVANKQPLAQNLTALSGVTSASDKLAYFTGVGAASTTDLTPAARLVLSSTTQKGMRDSLGFAASRAFLSEMSLSSFAEGLGGGWLAGANGTIGNANKYNYFTFRVSEDSVSQKVGTNGATGSKVNGVHILHTFGGNTARGGRHGLETTLIQSSPCASDSEDRFYSAAQSQILTTTGDGGTSTTLTKGAYFGGSSYAGAYGSSQYMANLTSWEFNTDIAAGVANRVAYHSGVQISSLIGQRGFNLDTAISVSNLAGSTFGWNCGIFFGSQNGRHAFDADSVLFKVSNNGLSTMFSAMDFTGLNFSNSIITAQDFSLKQNGLTLGKVNSSINLGSTSAASNVSLNMNSSGNNIDYDTRITSVGGTSALGKGTIQVDGDLVFNSDVGRPSADNRTSWGSNGFRYSIVYSAQGVNTTSDGRVKENIINIPDVVLDAMENVPYRQYNIREIDDRKHFGIVAQEIVSAFKAKGLDALEYGLVEHGFWDATPAVMNGDEILQPAQEAGDRFSVNYSEINILFNAVLDRKIKRLEAMMSPKL